MGIVLHMRAAWDVAWARREAHAHPQPRVVLPLTCCLSAPPFSCPQLMLMHIGQLWHYPEATLFTEIPHSGIPSWVRWQRACARLPPMPCLLAGAAAMSSSCRSCCRRHAASMGMCTPLLLLGQLLHAVGPPADLLCASCAAPAGALVLLHLHLGSGAADSVPEEDVLSSAP